MFKGEGKTQARGRWALPARASRRTCLPLHPGVILLERLYHALLRRRRDAVRLCSTATEYEPAFRPSPALEQAPGLVPYPVNAALRKRHLDIAVALEAYLPAELPADPLDPEQRRLLEVDDVESPIYQPSDESIHLAAGVHP